MNVYDFDKTIYDGDCTVDFYFYCLTRFPEVRKTLIPNIINLMKWKCNFINKKDFKNKFLSFVSLIQDLNIVIDLFWDDSQRKIKKFYLDQRKPDDLVISASPDFLIKPICERLKINSISTKYDLNQLIINGENCYGKEKVERYRSLYGDTPIDCFYSDSISDMPLALMANESFLVKKKKLIRWTKGGGYHKVHS